MNCVPIDEVSTYEMLEEIFQLHRLCLIIVLIVIRRRAALYGKHRKLSRPYEMLTRIPAQVQHLDRMVRASDTDCVINLRMDRNAFGRLCELLRELGGLHDGKYVSVDEQVAMFLSVLAHHKKNLVLGFDFQRSGQTISQYVHAVLKAVLKLHDHLLVKPSPIEENNTDNRWRWFPGCLGALDGTYIPVHVRNEDLPRFRNRKGQIATNVLAACDTQLRFSYVLAGWEGSAADGRVLRDAITRPHGLKVPRGCYYLCDNAYANSDGFLIPFKGVRYHLKEWGPGTRQPQSPDELFNMRHTKARNVIERAFGVLKMRWGILRSASFYPIQTQIRLIMACFLLHNFIRSAMASDPIEDMWDETGDDMGDVDGFNNEDGDDMFVDFVEPTPAWNQKRLELRDHMWQATQP